MSVVASQLIAKVGSDGVEPTKQKLRDVGKEAKTTQGSFSEMRASSEEASSSLAGRLLGSLHSVGSGFVSTISNAGFFVSGLKSIYDASVGLVGGLIAPNAAMEQMRVSFSAFIPNAQQLTSTLADLKKFSAVTPYESKEVNQSALSLLNMDVQAQDLNKWLGNIGASVAKIGGSGDVFKDVTAIISQMGVKGKVTTEEMQQLTDRNIPAFKILANAMNVPVATLQDMISNGELGRDKIELLVESMGKFGGDAMVKQGQTFNGLLSTVKDNAEQALASFTGPLFDAAKGGLTTLGNLLSSQGFQSFATGAGQRVAEVFALIGQAIVYVGNVLRSISLREFNEAWRNTQVLLQDIEGRISRGISPALKLLKTDADPVAEVIGNLARGGLDIVTKALQLFNSVLLDVDREMATGKGSFIDFGNSIKPWIGDLRNIAGLLMGQFKDGLKFAGDSAKQLGDWFKSSVVPAIKDAAPGFQSLGHTLLENVIPAVIKIRGEAQQFIEHVIQKFGPIIGQIVPPLTRFAGVFAQDLSNGLKIVLPYVEQAAQAFFKFANGVIDRVTPIINEIIPYIVEGVKDVQAVWIAVWPYLQQILEGVWGMIKGIVEIGWSLVTGIINVGLDLLSGNWQQAWSDIKDMFSGIWKGIEDFLNGEMQTLQGILSGVGAFVDHFLIQPFRDALGTIGGIFGNIGKLISDTTTGNFGAIPGDLHSLHIPGFASGTPSAPGGWSLLGERGPELAYVPRGTQIFPASQTQQMLSGGSSSGAGQPIILQIDGHTFARVTLPYQVSAIRNTVGVWGV